MISVVVDPGVFVSALIGRRGSAPDLVLRAWVDDRLQIVVSTTLLDELNLVLARPKFRAYLDARTATEYVARIRRHATLIDDPETVPVVTRDRDDDYLVALARAAKVDALVSGDRDLVESGLTDPPVWTPRELADRLRRSTPEG